MTTHDLTLTHIAEGLGDRAVNVHFADQFEDGVMKFDYTPAGRAWSSTATPWR